MELERKNPYQGTIDLIRSVGAEKNPVVFHIAEVIAARPLKLKLGEITISSDRVYMDERLLKGYKRKYSTEGVKLNGVTDAVNTPDGAGSIAGEINSSSGRMTIITSEDYLKAGDHVILIPSADGQIFYLLSKVVKAPNE